MLLNSNIHNAEMSCVVQYSAAYDKVMHVSYSFVTQMFDILYTVAYVSLARRFNNAMPISTVLSFSYCFQYLIGFTLGGHRKIRLAELN